MRRGFCTLVLFIFAAILKRGIYREVVLRNNVKPKSKRASATREIPHLSNPPYKEDVVTVQMQIPFGAILRSWTLLPSHKLPVCVTCCYTCVQCIKKGNDIILVLIYCSVEMLSMFVCVYFML